jgi:hypothetical protein
MPYPHIPQEGRPLDVFHPMDAARLRCDHVTHDEHMVIREGKGRKRKEREGKEREGKGREGKGKKGKEREGREGKGRKGKGRDTFCCYSIRMQSWNRKIETRHWKMLFLKLEV